MGCCCQKDCQNLATYVVEGNFQVFNRILKDFPGNADKCGSIYFKVKMEYPIDVTYCDNVKLILSNHSVGLSLNAYNRLFSLFGRRGESVLTDTCFLHEDFGCSNVIKATLHDQCPIACSSRIQLAIVTTSTRTNDTLVQLFSMSSTNIKARSISLLIPFRLNIQSELWLYPMHDNQCQCEIAFEIHPLFKHGMSLSQFHFYFEQKRYFIISGTNRTWLQANDFCMGETYGLSLMKGNCLLY